MTLCSLNVIKEKILAALAELPNYTCTETVDRSRKRALDRKFEPLDRVRVEIAVVGHNELFGWPGSRSWNGTSPAWCPGSSAAATSRCTSGSSSSARKPSSYPWERSSVETIARCATTIGSPWRPVGGGCADARRT